LHRDVSRDFAGDIQRQRRDRNRAKPGKLGLQFVRAGLQRGEPEAAVALGHYCSDQTGVGIPRGDGHAGKHASLRILNHSRDDARRRLRHRRWRDEGHCDEQRGG
jgi:hypothetical protein